MERKEAMSLGLNTFTTGRPCVNGHLAFRYTSSGSCSECINGSPKKLNPKTFYDKANELRITALRVYNESIQLANDNYERALNQANVYETQAKNAEIEESVSNAKKIVKISDYKAQQARKEALKRMIKLNVFIHPSDVINCKAWLLDKAREVCPNITQSDVNYRNKVQGGVLYEIKCFPEHQSEILAETNKAYNEHVAPTPQ